MAGLTILCCKDPGRTWGRYVLLRLVSISATVDLQLIDGALDPLGSSYVSDSKLELERLTGHRMIPALSVSLLGWDNDLLLFVHFHTHQGPLLGPYSTLDCPTHEGHDIAKRQMRYFGGMPSFQVRGGYDRAVGVALRVKLFLNATSLGGTESPIEHRASSEGEYFQLFNPTCCACQRVLSIPTT